MRDGARLRAVATASLLAALVLGACGPRSSAKPEPPRSTLRIVCPVADAELWVDERFVAPVGRLPRGVRLEPGKHRIEIRHDRYHAHYAVVELEPEEAKTLKVELAERLP